MTKHFFGFLATVLFILPGVAGAASSGFSSENITLEPKHPSEGESVEVSVSFVNYESASLSGLLVFYNNEEKLGSREMSLEAGEEASYSITWSAALGTHSFTARAENLKLSGSNVRILTPSTEPLQISIGFKDSEVADRLREKGGAGVIAAGVWQEVENFVVPLYESVDLWRFERIAPLEATKIRIQGDKEQAEGKIKPILVMHSAILVVWLFIIKTKIVFWVISAFISIWLFVKIAKRIRRLFRKKYTEEDA